MKYQATKLIFLVLVSTLGFSLFLNCSGTGGGSGPNSPNEKNDIEFLTPTYVAQWGQLGSYRETGNFQTPVSLLWANGYLHASDGFGNQWVQKFDTNGLFISSFGVPTPVGSDGAFSGPEGMAVDDSGNIYVVDSPQHRVQVFSSTGAFIRKWGSNGTGNGTFSYPYGVAVSGTTVYVSDEDNHLIQRFDTSGNFLGQWGGLGTGSTHLQFPRGLVIDGSGNLYVANSGMHDIRKFSSAGTYLATIGGQSLEQGDLFTPEGIAIGPDSRLYVSNFGRNSVSVFTLSGNFLGKWGHTGNGNSQFNSPQGIAVDPQNNIYVMDSGNFRIQKFAVTTSPPSDTSGTSSTPHRLVISRLPRRLNGTSADTANGTTISSPTGLSCSNCFATAATLTGTVTLNTTFQFGTNSISWSGDCSSNTITMDSDKYCNFTYSNGSQTYLVTSGTLYTLRVSKAGGGTGTVSSNPAGINCGATCTTTTTQATYGTGNTSFTLTAAPSIGSSFVRWAGDCSGTATMATVTLSSNLNCTAVFETP